ncbi:MAG TPA: adenosylcobalamin-dependent ribonucleoside-diphosphate reductase [Flavobacteriales bacterium]|nr:adenosylcobalamin-dependent ribonucleoside-diphosphate reductase [Flavobacteriales bacterium]
MYTEEEVKEATLKYFNNDELATNVFITKYCLKDQEGLFLELTPDDMHRRLAKEFSRIEKQYNSKNELPEDDIYECLKGFKYIVPQGSPMMGIGNNHVNVSLSNCVVVESPDDNISSIMDAGKHLANLFKRRCGVGVDISNLRPENAPVNNSARTTTGAWSFADFYSFVCRMIGQNGRRGALMISMDIRHPDIEKFVVMKKDLTKVTGANVSVKISDDFMRAVESKEKFTLQFPVNSEEPVFTKEVNAQDLWSLIVESATKTAEPGILMWDNIINNLPAECYKDQGFRTLTTNPCGEIPLSAYDSCRLISMNLKNIVKNPFQKNAEFDFVELKRMTAVAMRLSDDLVELELEKLKSIIDACDTPSEKELWHNLETACENGRRTGLGTHGLADAVARLNLRYDSDEALETIERIYETIRDAAYEESVYLAQERGAFPAFNWEKEEDNAFINRLPPGLQKLISTHGRRNISILTNAPTGSVSIMSQTSSGLEPVFRNWYIRRRKLSHNEQDIEPDYVDDLGDKWMEYRVFDHNLQEYFEMFSTEEIPDFFVESNDIDWKQRVMIQAAIQKSIDHSISSTINLPENTNPEVVGELYQLGWKLGLKGITVYVEGSRSGVLVSKEKAGFRDHPAPKRPIELPCNIHHATIQGERWMIVVGLMDGRPYEVMGGLSNLIEIPKKYDEGILVKHPRKTMNSIYDLRIGRNGDSFVVKDLVKVFDNPNHSAFTRIISLGLRHGTNIQYVVEQLQKDRDADLFSFAKCVSRVLKNYIKDGTRATEKTCTECKTEGLIYVEGCITCKSCGFSKCG